ncbi:MAG: anti-sigma regulatory factor [Actinomycetota bacterium]|nr:anti-sigma regulatory factor [Actinomycetota bacterium]
MSTEDEVRLDVPATPEYLHLARVTASGLASRLGFSFDEVEDLRLALDELCFALIGSQGRPGSVQLRYALTDGTLLVEGRGTFGSDGVDPSLTEFSQKILSALVDEYRVYRDELDSPCFRLVKHRAAVVP